MDIEPTALQILLDAIHSKRPVEGLTHDLYRYPARFSPEFARAVIDQFSSVGSYMIDPFMGGGTSIVEAVAMGRYAIGIDLNPLAHFITDVKTTPLTSQDTTLIRNWFKKSPVGAAKYIDSSDHIVNLPLRLKMFFEQYLGRIMDLRTSKQRKVARTALLKTGQWALDCRTEIPTRKQIAYKLNVVVEEVLEALSLWTNACHESGISNDEILQRRKLLCCSAAEAPNNAALRSTTKQIRLLITSPPYPGVHVLYHRWQVQGRRETPTPYWLTGQNDGNGESFYTLGGRSKIGIERYFNSITHSFRSIRPLLHPKAYVVQLVAFSHIGSQLARYSKAMGDAGYTEIESYSDRSGSRIWRKVPNRKWYADVHGEGDSMKEFLFIHRPSK